MIIIMCVFMPLFMATLKQDHSSDEEFSFPPRKKTKTHEDAIDVCGICCVFCNVTCKLFLCSLHKMTAVKKCGPEKPKDQKQENYDQPTYQRRNLK